MATEEATAIGYAPGVMKPLVVVVIVATNEPYAASTPMMEEAARQALEPNAVVLVQHVGASATDADALRLRDLANADAIAVVTWPDGGRAHLHILPSRDSLWIERDLDFALADAVVERGRFVGFALGAMIPRARRSEESPVQAPKPVLVETPATEHSPSGPSSKSERRRGAFELVGTASTGVGGCAGGYGAGGSARVRIATAIEIRAGASLRIGSIEPARVDVSTLKLDAGIAWLAWRTKSDQPLSAGVRLDGVAMRQGLSRPIDVDAASRGARWLGGMDMMIESAWDFVPEGALVAAIGAEVVFGTTRVVVDDVHMASIPKVRIVGELGVRARF